MKNTDSNPQKNPRILSNHELSLYHYHHYHHLLIHQSCCFSLSSSLSPSSPSPANSSISPRHLKRSSDNPRHIRLITLLIKGVDTWRGEMACRDNAYLGQCRGAAGSRFRILFVCFLLVRCAVVCAAFAFGVVVAVVKMIMMILIIVMTVTITMIITITIRK